jgi:uncharacterized protein YciI
MFLFITLLKKISSMKKLLMFVSLLTFGSQLFAQNTGKKPSGHAMKNYYMVLLIRSAQAPKMDSIQLEKIQEGHMAHINEMAANKKLAMAGPFLDNDSLRGIFIFDVVSKEEVIKLCQEDPAVKSGRLKFTVRT